MRISATLALLAVGLVAAAHPQAEPAAEDPAAVFAELDGTWAGAFVGYDAEGVELYRIRVRRTYETLDATRQRVAIVDVMQDGERITGTGMNTCVRRVDGSLALECAVQKSNGDTVKHTGRVTRGPDGVEQIIWFSKAPGREEIFRERVHRVGKELVYAIDGTGRYGDSVVLMAGRYVKQK